MFSNKSIVFGKKKNFQTECNIELLLYFIRELRFVKSKTHCASRDNKTVELSVELKIIIL